MKQTAIQVELYYGVVPLGIYERCLEAIIQRNIAGDLGSADTARISLGEALGGEADALMNGFCQDQATQALLFPLQGAESPAEVLVPWVALHLETEGLVFRLKRLGKSAVLVTHAVLPRWLGRQQRHITWP